MQVQINQSSKPQIKLSKRVQEILVCPICHNHLDLGREDCNCTECKAIFPINNGIPILIDENSSIFSVKDFLYHRNTTFNLSRKNKFIEFLNRLIPSISINIKTTENYHRLIKLLLARSTNPKVLVVGGSILGKGTEVIVKDPDIELVETDVSFGPRTTLICDGHSLPFADNSFDGVIIQAVLEHVIEPSRCVEEIYRVLKDDGLVYAETPFMQQVHAGCYDFTRFTHLGHRRLFRKFEEIDSGATCGPGMALAWAYNYLLLSFTTSKFLRKLIGLFVRLTVFPLKYLDYLLINRPGTLDAASAYYFIGKKSDQILSDKKLVNLYKGVC